MRRWVIADTHFGHTMLIEKGYRPPDYDKRIIDRWASMVSPEDLVIHLGDVALPDKVPDVWTMLANLPGRKILVMGNHDKRSVTWYMARGFAFACDMFELGRIVFSHRPITTVPDDVAFNVHGHLHTGEHRPFDAGPKHRLVAIENTDYAPMLIEKVTRAQQPAPGAAGYTLED